MAKLIGGNFRNNSRRAKRRLLLSRMLAISVSSSIDVDGIIEGNRLEKKSLSAVATALTGMSSCLMETFESNKREKKEVMHVTCCIRIK